MQIKFILRSIYARKFKISGAKVVFAFSFGCYVIRNKILPCACIFAQALGVVVVVPAPIDKGTLG